jgi:hypothetical protein
MATTAGTIIDQAEILLQDTANARWGSTELLAWLNQGQDQIVQLKPDAMALVVSTKMTASKTRQSLPDGTASYKDESGATLRYGLKLLDIIRNMGAAGSSPGKSISIIDKNLLDLTDPTWHYTGRSNIVQHYMYNEKIPREFYIYPAAHASTQTWVEISYVAKPTAASTTASNIDLSDIYASVLLDYVLFRAFSKSSDSQIHMTKALGYYEAFIRALGSFSAAETGFDPNNLSQVPSPSIRR